MPPSASLYSEIIISNFEKKCKQTYTNRGAYGLIPSDNKRPRRGLNSRGPDQGGRFLDREKSSAPSARNHYPERRAVADHPPRSYPPLQPRAPRQRGEAASSRPDPAAS